MLTRALNRAVSPEVVERRHVRILHAELDGPAGLLVVAGPGVVGGASGIGKEVIHLGRRCRVAVALEEGENEMACQPISTERVVGT